ncbi:HEAT repeat domain-containing protein [Hathewaya histolytica]|uniref:HEAT repeat domain-containing protein n=1 Tax=Hathewaya histolytica TaxID=1498 RepID=UPI003B681702
MRIKMDKDNILMKELIELANDYGFEVESYDDLKAIKRKIKSLVPVLIKYLYMFEKKNFKDAIVDLLGVKGFYGATETLINLYYTNSVTIDKWDIGDALYSIQDKRFEDKYIEIVKDKTNGDSRQMIVILLGKLRLEKAISILIELLKDDDVNGHAIMALGYFKNDELIKHIEPFLHHEKSWIRKETEKAIKKIKS